MCPTTPCSDGYRDYATRVIVFGVGFRGRPAWTLLLCAPRRIRRPIRSSAVVTNDVYTTRPTRAIANPRNAGRLNGATTVHHERIPNRLIPCRRHWLVCRAVYRVTRHEKRIRLKRSSVFVGTHRHTFTRTSTGRYNAGVTIPVSCRAFSVLKTDSHQRCVMGSITF